MRICNIPYPCPICGKPRKLRYSSSRNRQINQLTGDYFYKTCGDKKCISIMKSRKIEPGRKQTVGKSCLLPYRGLSLAIKKSKKSPVKAVKKYMAGFEKYLIIDNVLKKQYRERKQQEANDFFEELKRKAKELNEHR